MKLLTYIIILSFISCSSLTQPSVTAKAIIITGQQLDSIRTIFEKPIANCNIDIIVLKKADTLNYDSTSSVDTNVNILQVRLPGKQKDIETDIAVSNSFGNYTYSGKLGDTVLCEQSPNHWFLAWFDEPFYKSSVVGNLNENHRYELHIRAIEKDNGNITADETLYTKDCCLDRLDIKYNPYTESLLFAFNDFGGKDYKLMYGFIEIGENKFVRIKKPYQIMFKDETEKRQPIFTDNGSNLFLYHTTGDSWRLLSGHTGEQQIGIFKIDSSNSLIEHKIISDKEGIEDRIIVGLDTVFYRLITGNEYDKMPIKKVALSDLKNIN